MTAKMTEADFDAMYDAWESAGIVGGAVHDPDPDWLAKSKRGQGAARAGVEAEDLLREPPIGEKAASFAAGAAESASMGAAPYLHGAVRAMDPFVRPGQPGFVVDDPIAGIPKRFREGVESQREGMEAMHENKRGGAFGGGHLTADIANLIGGVAAPVKSAVTAGKAIAGGAPASSVLKTGMRPIIDKVRGALAEPLTAMGSRADELRALTPSAAVGGAINEPKILKEIQTFPGDAAGYAQWLRDTGVSRGINTSTGIEKRSAELLGTSGKAIGEQIARATSKGGSVDTNSLVQSLRDQADQIDAVGGVTDTDLMHSAKLREFADRLAAKFTGGTAPIEGIKRQSIQMGREAKTSAQSAALGHPVKGNALATLDARRTQEEAILDALESAGIDPADVKKAKLDFMGSRITNQNANAALGRAEKSGPLNLMEGIIATKSAPLAAVYKTTRPLWASTKAAGAETARSLGEAVAPALTSAQTATVQRALAAGNTPQMVANAMQLPLDAIEALAIGTAVKPSSAFALGKSALAGQAEGDRLEAMKKRLAAP